MTLRLVRRAAALAVAALFVTVPAAHAEKVVTEDAVGDVQAIDFDAEEDFLPAPDHAASDITRTVAAYGATRLSVVVHFRDLLNTSNQSTVVRVRTPRGRYDFQLVRVPGRRAEVLFGRPRGGETECRGVRGKFDGAADLVSMSVPTACLASPNWVQLSVAAVVVAEPLAEAPGEQLVAFVDDAHRDTMRETSIGKGPRIHRG